MIRYIKNANICVRMEIPPFDGIDILNTHISWILMTQVQEIRSSYGSEITLVSRFGTMEMCSYVSWTYLLIPIN